MSNTITLQNAPRDYNELIKINRTVRYRLGLSLTMWGHDQGAEEAFLALGDEAQATELFHALQRYDAAGGGNGVQQQPPQAQPQPQAPPQAPPPAYPPQQQQYAPPPQGYAPQGPPPQAQPGYGPPQGQYPQAPPQGPPPGQPPMRSPSTASDPSNAGAMHPPPNGYMPPAGPAPQQGYVPPQQQPPQWQGPPQGPPPQGPPPAAHPLVAPQNGQSGAPASSVLLDILKKIQTSIDDEVPGIGDIEELKDILLGMAKIQQSLAVITLLLADNALGMQRGQLIALVERELAAGSYNQLAGTQGKG